MSGLASGQGYVWHLLLPTLAHVPATEKGAGEPGSQVDQRGTESTEHAVRSGDHDGHFVSVNCLCKIF